MAHPCSRGWVGWCAEDGVCGVEDFEVFGVRGVDVMAGYCGWLVCVRVGIGKSLLKKILVNQVWEVRMANPLTEAM